MTLKLGQHTALYFNKDVDIRQLFEFSYDIAKQIIDHFGVREMAKCS